MSEEIKKEVKQDVKKEIRTNMNSNANNNSKIEKFKKRKLNAINQMTSDLKSKNCFNRLMGIKK